MNYSQDALWWKLTSAPVRDLASLLTAPPLWHSGCELPVRTLLGEHGFRYLLSLDENPAPLHDFLAGQSPQSRRLGFYAEKLLAFWFSHAPHAVLHARNLAVLSDGGRMAGAADFVATLNGTPYHIELTCKYYGSGDGLAENLCGLNPDDRFTDKAAKLTRQLGLLQSSDGLKALSGAGLAFQTLKPASIVRGIGFFPQGSDRFEPPLNPFGWHGTYIRHWQDYPFDDETRYYPLPRMNLLAPARVAEAETQTADEIRLTRLGLIAAVIRRPDGFWHEIRRIMKT